MSSMVRDFPLEANILADGVMRAFASFDEGSVVVEPPAISLLNSRDLPTCYLAGVAETQLSLPILSVFGIRPQDPSEDFCLPSGFVNLCRSAD